MTVADLPPIVIYTGNGVTTVFPYSFWIQQQEDAVVSLQTIATGVITPLVDGVDYTITGVSVTPPGGGNVTKLGTALSAAQRLIIARVIAPTQDLDIENQDGFLPNTLEYQLDRIVMMLQGIEEGAVKLVPGIGIIAAEHIILSDGLGTYKDGGLAADTIASQAAIAAAAAALVSEASATASAASATASAATATAQAVSATASAGSATASAAAAAASAASAASASAGLTTKGADIASAATPNIAAATGHFIHITGTVTITGFTTTTAGLSREVIFDGALILTNSASLILPWGQNIKTAAGDSAVFISEGAGVWRMTQWQPKTPPGGFLKRTVITASGTHTLDPNTRYVHVEVQAAGGGGGGCSTSSSGGSNGAGGGAGGYVSHFFAAAGNGTVVVGAAGAAGAVGAGGGTGGTSSWTDATNTLSATGGSGGGSVGSSSAGVTSTGGVGGVGTGGSINGTGDPGEGGFGLGTNAFAVSWAMSRSGKGGSSRFGGGGLGVDGSGNLSTSSAGVAATGKGAGGGGAQSSFNGLQQVGGAGAAGVVTVTEYA